MTSRSQPPTKSRIRSVADLNKRFPAKHLGEVTRYMGSEYGWDREKGTLETSQTQFIRNVVECFGITKSSVIPAETAISCGGPGPARNKKEVS